MEVAEGVEDERAERLLLLLGPPEIGPVERPPVHEVAEATLHVRRERDAPLPVVRVPEFTILLHPVLVHVLRVPAEGERGEETLVVELARVVISGRPSLELPHLFPRSVTEQPVTLMLEGASFVTVPAIARIAS